MSEWLPTYLDLSSSLLNQSIRNPQGKGVANKNRKSAADPSNNTLAPRAVSQGSRKQCQHERNPKLAEYDVPRRIRNHAAIFVLPPMNSPRHLLVERNIDCAKQPDHEQTNVSETFHNRSPTYPNCTATTSQAKGIQSGDRQIIGPPPIE